MVKTVLPAKATLDSNVFVTRLGENFRTGSDAANGFIFDASAISINDIDTATVSDFDLASAIV